MTTRLFFRLIKPVLALAVFFGTACTGLAQYYYKDLLATQQVNRTYLLYKNNKITGVNLSSFEGNRPVTEGFQCEQKVSGNQVVTYTKTADAGESYFTATYNAKGLLVKSIDSSEAVISTTQYQYDALDRLLQVSNETHARDKSSQTSETHTWEYNGQGKPVKMYRIKNRKDSLGIAFKLDDKMNVAEETVVKGAPPASVYYYYDDQNRLTDIVRYNEKAGRLLPDYVFEWDDSGDLSTMLVVSEGSSDYLKWYYKYDDAGLKAVEFCYDKKKVLQGRIEYNYHSGSR